MADYYEILGISKTASADEIKKAYRRIAVRNHPDKQKNKSLAQKKIAEERFKSASEAYEILSDDEKRQKYDTYGRAGIEADGDFTHSNAYDIFSRFFNTASAGGNGFSFGGFQHFNDPSTFEPGAQSNMGSMGGMGGIPGMDGMQFSGMNIPGMNGMNIPGMSGMDGMKQGMEGMRQGMDSMRQGMRGMRGTGRGARPGAGTGMGAGMGAGTGARYSRNARAGAAPNPEPKIGPQSEIEYAVTLTEYMNGASKNLEITYDIGSEVINDVITLDIRPGMRAGVKFTFPGKASCGKDEIPGNLIVVLTEDHDDMHLTRFYRRSMLEPDGSHFDTVHMLDVTVEEALKCGIRTIIRNIDGKRLRLDIDPLNYSTDEYVIENEGLPIRKAGKIVGRGDLYIRFKIQMNGD